MPPDNLIPIGVLGPEPMVSKVLKVISASFPSFRPLALPYSSEEEATRIAQEALPDIEVLLLTNPGLYRRLKEELPPAKPIQYLPLTDTALYRALYRVRSRLPAGELLLSVDSFTPQAISRLKGEIGEKELRFVLFEGEAHPSASELAGFHAEACRSGGAHAALTTEPEVARALREQGVPHEWVVPTDSNIVVALERALLSTETRRSKEAQIVVGMVNVDDFSKQIRLRSSEHDIQRFKLDIHRMLIDYAESLEGYLTHVGGDEYLFFTTRGIFERETGGYKTIPLAREVGKALGLSLSMGIGFGRSANEAGTHARTALRKAKEAGGSSCFIVREDRTLIGPLEMADPLNHDLSVTDGALLKAAEEAGMTSAYLSRLMASVARTGKLEYEVQELAAVLDITVRSTHRLLTQWIDHGLVEVSGYVKVPKGRPKQTFRLRFLEDHAAARLEESFR
ncbi:hypothetical protein MJA45_22540 [Paenibacillus aurantius]|uniref:GGDEF domain-containing protein n=1 Tax=Paenibacillus aurantius TaxID=2918900 RepID=A0AA96LC16_9BACL|nr:hypothetical protein [Paenibacillus aurantius]WNQ10373.1 hypothetical protein MJA45_22540 [Paenibacillus aurantius]